MGQAKQRGLFEERAAASAASHASYLQRQYREQQTRLRYAATVRHQTPQRITRDGTAVLKLVSLTFTIGSLTTDH